MDNGVLVVTEPSELIPFPGQEQFQLGVVERGVPAGADEFFAVLLGESSFEEVGGLVSKANAKAELEEMLDEVVGPKAKGHPFFETWVGDMAATVALFCDMVGEDCITLWTGTDRGCYKYHVDKVDLRMLCTYSGTGTEWVPDAALDRAAFANREPSDVFVTRPDAVRFLTRWDVAVFRGGPNGIVHRTPDAAIKTPSVLLRLDLPAFWHAIQAAYAAAGDMDLESGEYEYYSSDGDNGDDDNGEDDPSKTGAGAEKQQQDECQDSGCACGQ